MNVLHVVLDMKVGGAENAMVKIINHSSPQFRHCICALRSADVFAERLLPEKRDLVLLNKKTGNDWSVIPRIKQIIDEKRIHVVHGWGWPAYMEGLIPAKFSLRRCGYLFAFRGKRIEELNGIPLHRIMTERALSFLADGIVTPCRIMKEDYARTYHIRRNMIQVIYNGFDFKSQVFPSPVEVRQQLGFSQENIVVGTVARLDPVKNIDSLIEAVQRVRRSMPMLKLLVVGDGDERLRLEEYVRARELQRDVCFAGNQEDCAPFYAAMDVFVLPSLYEGFSNTLLEAMAYRLPVIASDVGGNAEIIIDGETGLLFPPRNVDKLASLIHQYATDRETRHATVSKAYQYAQEHFSIERMVEAHGDLYLRIGHKYAK